MLKKLLFLLILSTSSFAQFTSADFELAGTTFERKFDRKIIEKYISSSLPSNINAALLSMSSAQDTSLIPLIVSPAYGKFGSMIAFALGETGPNSASEKFLLEKIISGRFPEHQHAAFEALGRCGSLESLNSIVSRYFSSPEFRADGISIAIAGFSARGIKTVDTFEVKVLMKELSDSRISIKRKAEAAFAASRIGLNRNSKNDLLRLLFEKHDDETGTILKQYILASLRRMRQGPDSPEQIKSLLSNREWRIRTEAAKLISSLPVKNSETLRLFFDLFTDKNPNVSRQAAISLKDMKIDSSLAFFLKEELKKTLLNSTVAPNTAGELFIAYCSFSSDEIFGLIDKLKGRIRPDFVYRALAANNTSPSRKLNYLLTAADPSNKNEKLEHLNAVLSLQKSLPGNSQIENHLLSYLSGSFPAGISIAADGLDSALISEKAAEIRRIIMRQINLYMNNSNYTESIMSLVSLARKISPDFANEILLSLRSSLSYSIQTYLARETGKPVKSVKQSNNFFEFWSNAFKYKSARVKTEKGDFTIRFAPEYCPVSVGNFCKLAAAGFFNDVVYHRVVPDFVIQTGDPDGTGWGGPGYDIISEFSPAPFERSYVGMASAGKDTEGSQWFVMHSSFPHLNGKYSNFGRVTEGMEAVDKIDQGDKILSIELIK